MTILVGSRFSPALGGHAPGDVRDAFCEALEAYRDWETGEPEPTVALRQQQLPISKIFGLLWNCSDILPSSAWLDVKDVGLEDDVKTRTYGAVARVMKPAVVQARAEAVPEEV